LFDHTKSTEKKRQTSIAQDASSLEGLLDRPFKVSLSFVLFVLFV
jgi:hypothetical protein